MLSPEERYEIDQAVYATMVQIEHQVEHNAGSYGYLCLVQNEPTFCHYPAGPVLRYVPPHPMMDCGLGY
jgi:hypothetical protein